MTIQLKHLLVLIPKGETAVITACEKEFGDKAIPVAEKNDPKT